MTSTPEPGRPATDVLDRAAPPAEGGMERRALVAGITVLAYASLYAPQPLLPMFAVRFGVTESTAALLITATLLPLGVAPLSYGYLLGRVAPGTLLRVAVIALGALEVAFALAESFPVLVGLRLAQGLLLPAVLTSLMTYVAMSAGPGRTAREMAVYVASSILGGYLGRLLAGLGAAYLDWRAVFVVLGAGLVASGVPAGRLRVPERASPAQAPGLRRALAVLRRGRVARVCALVFAFFFVFASLLNFLPFRLAELDPGGVEVWSGLVYTGYLFGVATALGSGRVSARVGGPERTLVAGFTVFVAALACTLVADPWALFAALFAFCGAMFLMHAVASGFVHPGDGSSAGIVNGLYLASYYSGGVLGSYLPGFVYERSGWTPFVLTLLGVAGAGWAVSASLLTGRRPDGERAASRRGPPRHGHPGRRRG